MIRAARGRAIASRIGARSDPGDRRQRSRSASPTFARSARRWRRRGSPPQPPPFAMSRPSSMRVGSSRPLAGTSFASWRSAPRIGSAIRTSLGARVGRGCCSQVLRRPRLLSLSCCPGTAPIFLRCSAAFNDRGLRVARCVYPSAGADRLGGRAGCTAAAARCRGRSRWVGSARSVARPRLPRTSPRARSRSRVQRPAGVKPAADDLRARQCLQRSKDAAQPRRRGRASSRTARSSSSGSPRSMRAAPAYGAVRISPPPNRVGGSRSARMTPAA